MADYATEIMEGVFRSMRAEDRVTSASDDAALAAAWARHGGGELRAGVLRAALVHYERLHGLPPADVLGGAPL